MLKYFFLEVEDFNSLGLFVTGTGTDLLESLPESSTALYINSKDDVW